MLPPDLIHFFSYATGVSLELPRGFVVAGDTDASQSYARYTDDDEAVDAYLDVRRLAAADTEYDAAALRAAVTAAVDSFAVGAADESDRQWLTVDRAEVLRTTLHYPGGLPGSAAGRSGAVVDLLTGDIAVIVAVTAVGGVLVSLTGAVPWPDRIRLGVFVTALDSVRFVMVGAA